MKKEKTTLEREIILKELDAEQAEYEAVDYIVSSNQQEEKSRLKAIVEANIKKKKAINIRVLEADIIKIKSKALSKGIPYQTLINSIIHQFANDKLIEA